jgi:hypothetical protein
MLDTESLDTRASTDIGFVLRTNEVVANFIRKQLKVDNSKEHEESESSSTEEASMNFEIVRLNHQKRLYGLLIKKVMFYCTLCGLPTILEAMKHRKLLEVPVL